MLDKIAGYIPVNWGLLKNPINWIIVFLMIAFAGLALGMIVQSSEMPNETAE